MSEQAPWPFPVGPEAPVLTQRGVAFLGRPVLLVLHDPEGDWQMLGEGSGRDRAHVLGLGTIVGRDPSLLALHDLPRGWIARRRASDQLWERIVPGEPPAAATDPGPRPAQDGVTQPVASSAAPAQLVAPVPHPGQLSGEPDAAPDDPARG